MQVKLTPEIKNKYIKLCWMGSGEPLTYSEKIKEATSEIISKVLKNNLAIGLDGVDISTTYPKTNRWKKHFVELIDTLKGVKLNPLHNGSALRIFYSLHNASSEKRDKLIPNSNNPLKAIKELNFWCKENKVSFIIHHMFINNVNDNKEDIKSLEELLKGEIDRNTEFRILRYNAPNNETEESYKLKEIVSKIKEFIPEVKIQHSSGYEIKAACGQFL